MCLILSRFDPVFRSQFWTWPQPVWFWYRHGFHSYVFFYTFKGGINFINLWDGDYGQFYMVLPHEPCDIENGYYSSTVKQWVYVVVKNDWYYIV